MTHRRLLLWNQIIIIYTKQIIPSLAQNCGSYKLCPDHRGLRWGRDRPGFVGDGNSVSLNIWIFYRQAWGPAGWRWWGRRGRMSRDCSSPPPGRQGGDSWGCTVWSTTAGSQASPVWSLVWGLTGQCWSAGGGRGGRESWWGHCWQYWCYHYHFHSIYTQTDMMVLGLAIHHHHLQGKGKSINIINKNINNPYFISRYQSNI